MNKNAIRRLLAAVSATGLTVGAFLASSAAHADVPAAVTTAITSSKEDMLAAVGAVIAAMVVVWGLRKLGQKLGWL